MCCEHGAPWLQAPWAEQMTGVDCLPGLLWRLLDDLTCFFPLKIHPKKSKRGAGVRASRGNATDTTRAQPHGPRPTLRLELDQVPQPLLRDIGFVLCPVFLEGFEGSTVIGSILGAGNLDDEVQHFLSRHPEMY